MRDPRQDNDPISDAATDPGDAVTCTEEELLQHGGPGFQLFAELVEGAAKASGIPGYALVALCPGGGMASMNGGTEDDARELCSQLVVSAGNELNRRIRAVRLA